MKSFATPPSQTANLDHAAGKQSRDHMDIARVAKRLWNEAGRPAGRYVEYWAKAEHAVVAAREANLGNETVGSAVQNQD